LYFHKIFIYKYLPRSARDRTGLVQFPLALLSFRFAQITKPSSMRF